MFLQFKTIHSSHHGRVLISKHVILNSLTSQLTQGTQDYAIRRYATARSLANKCYMVRETTSLIRPAQKRGNVRHGLEQEQGKFCCKRSTKELLH